MRKISIVLFLIFLSLLAYAVVSIAPYGRAVEISAGMEKEPDTLVFKSGETLTYRVSYKGLRIGKSVLTFNGEKDLGGEKVYHITFSTRVPSLKDTEEIYADKVTWLPLEVHRNIKKKVGFNDSIVEKYDQKKFRIDIKQKSKLRSKDFSIEKDAPIHNAILLPYYYRSKESFSESEKLKINLPTMDFEVMFDGVETVRTPLGEYKAYVFTSDPPKFKLWLSADERRIPLKIKNPDALGYSLIIEDIN
ncbi:MAG: DUF3108 domain-containing protein [Candidatus Omnitrophica bacterium]|nr:DUF3108 domain-containing protein [Candidatus Omnitrophota bacterium]